MPYIKNVRLTAPPHVYPAILIRRRSTRYELFRSIGLIFGFERNMFDRVAHFAVGFYALPVIEYLVGRD